jgi:hypothetical protein
MPRVQNMQVEEIFNFQVEEIQEEYLEKLSDFGVNKEDNSNNLALRSLLSELFYLDEKVMYSRSQIEWVSKAVEESIYPSSQFTYGTVPLSAFIELFSSFEEEFSKMKKEGKAFFALGSSIGWVAFLAHLYFGFKNVVGIELIENLQSISEFLNQKYKLGNNIHFEHGDVLEKNYKNAGVVWLPSILWSESSKTSIETKLLKDLDEEALIFSLNSPGEDFFHAFQFLKTITTSSSWSPDQTYWAYKKRPKTLSEEDCYKTWFSK